MSDQPAPQVLDGLITSEFPGDADAAESLLLDLGATHLLSISSAQLPKPTLPSIFHHRFIDVPNNAREALLLELPHVCKFIDDAIAHGSRVLVQCRVELRACIVVCAYRERHCTVTCGRSAHSSPVMASRNIPPRQATSILEAGTSRALLTNRLLNTFTQPFHFTIQRPYFIVISNYSLRAIAALLLIIPSYTLGWLSSPVALPSGFLLKHSRSQRRPALPLTLLH